MTQGITITGLSPSADSKWSMCEQQYFIDYQLKIRSGGNQKALKGTIVHKILEIIAKAKKSIDGGSKIVNDETIGGNYYIDMGKWLKESELTTAHVDKINKSRSDKKVYKNNCKIVAGHNRRGVEFVDYIVSMVYAWYSNKHTEYTWTGQDYCDVRNWTWMVLDYKDGMYDPRLKNILSTEFDFEIPIEYDWAKYAYNLPDGTLKEGYLRLRGVIDLVLDQGDGTIEVIDYKTGSRIDWNTGKIKDFDYLQKDIQLMIYYYALRHLYKDVKDIWLTIFFVRDGGPFTLPYDDSHFKKIEKHIKNQFTKIKNTTLPNLLSKTQTHFKCKWCDYSKIQHGDTNLCAAVHQSIKDVGMDKTTELFKVKV